MQQNGKVQTDVHRFVVENFLFGRGDVSDTLALTEQGALDSTGVLELVMFVEETYGIPVADEDILPGNFDSIAGLASYIQRKQRTNL